jgi:uncharacterized protein (TIGR02271 family)
MASRTDKKSNGRATADSSRKSVIPVIQEQATVSKRIVETGKVRIAKHVREYEEIVDVPHFQEAVMVERVPIDRFIESAPEVRTEGDITIIPVVEERYVLERRLVLVEELHVRKERKESHHPEKVKVLKEEVEVQRLRPGEGPRSPKPRARAE